jgi:Na+/glutamate symporter
VLEIVTLLIAALFAAMLLLRRAARPRRAGVVLAVAVAVLTLPQLTYQLRYPVGGIDLIDRMSGFLAAAVILVVTLGWGTRRGAAVSGGVIPTEA